MTDTNHNTAQIVEYRPSYEHIGALLRFFGIDPPPECSDPYAPYTFPGPAGRAWIAAKMNSPTWPTHPQYRGRGNPTGVRLT